MSESLEQGKRKLTAKDAITAGALGAACIAIRFLFMLVGGISPYVWFATHFWWRRSERTAPSSSRALSPA